jgi:hypothetical protein
MAPRTTSQGVRADPSCTSQIHSSSMSRPSSSSCSSSSSSSFSRRAALVVVFLLACVLSPGPGSFAAGDVLYSSARDGLPPSLLPLSASAASFFSSAVPYSGSSITPLDSRVDSTLRTSAVFAASPYAYSITQARVLVRVRAAKAYSFSAAILRGPAGSYASLAAANAAVARNLTGRAGVNATSPHTFLLTFDFAGPSRPGGVLVGAGLDSALQLWSDDTGTNTAGWVRGMPQKGAAVRGLGRAPWALVDTCTAVGGS